MSPASTFGGRFEATAKALATDHEYEAAARRRQEFGGAPLASRDGIRREQRRMFIA
jgi:hypothetical protein